MSIVVRGDRCSGCRICEVVCSLENYGEANPGKSAIRVQSSLPGCESYRITVCGQCGDCAVACPEHCISFSRGAYRVEPARCTGCAICVEACPRGALFLHRGSKNPIRCNLCGACVTYCPLQALSRLPAGEGEPLG